MDAHVAPAEIHEGNQQELGRVPRHTPHTHPCATPAAPFTEMVTFTNTSVETEEFARREKAVPPLPAVPAEPPEPGSVGLPPNKAEHKENR